MAANGKLAHSITGALGLLISAIVIFSCAVPVAPTGGPSDREPPRIVESVPAAGTVNFDGETVRLVFSAYIDEGSFQRAVSFTPEFDSAPRFRWRGRRVDIQFAEPLRDNTTYIINLDNNLRDFTGAPLRQPISFAFSTGPVINEGRIEGSLFDPFTQQGLEGWDVFAFAAEPGAAGAHDRAPDYRVQTGQNGRFQLQYLPDTTFFVFALQDRNRNRRPDPGEPFAVPPELLMRPSQPGEGIRDHTFYGTVLDTVPPAIQRIRPLSQTRLSIRFSEPVQLASLDPRNWALEDSAQGRGVPIRFVFQRPADREQVFLVSDPLSNQNYRLRPAAIVDSSGNHVASEWHPFTAVTTQDTAVARFERFLPEVPYQSEENRKVLTEWQRAGIRLSDPVSPSELSAAVTIDTGSEDFHDFQFSTTDGTNILLNPEPALPPGTRFEVRVHAGFASLDSVIAQRYEILPADETGSLTGIVQPVGENTISVELFPSIGNERRPIQETTADGEGRFAFPDVPAGMYRVRAYEDQNETGSWFGGRIYPFEAAEPFAWNTDSLRVRARWETVADTLRLHEVPSDPVLPPSPPETGLP